jgi:fatty-acyl-CoA synthase
MLGLSIYVGSTDILTARPVPDNLLTLIAFHGIGLFFAPPTVWIALLRSPLFEATDLSSLHHGYYGASIMPVEVLREVPPRGAVGKIVHRSPHLMLGYLNDEERTAAAFKGGWFHSGDLAKMDEDGHITVVDRKKDMIKTGGENVAGGVDFPSVCATLAVAPTIQYRNTKKIVC